jgi:hypothetical protein
MLYRSGVYLKSLFHEIRAVNHRSSHVDRQQGMAAHYIHQFFFLTGKRD